MNLESIIQLGRRMGGTRGGEIQLEDKNAYLTNVKRSSLYKFTLNDPLGTGTFYSSQAMLNAENVERREEKVWFSWKEKGIASRQYVPNLESFGDTLEKVFKEKFVKEQFRITKAIMDVLLGEFLITRISIKDNKLLTRQIRSDGSVGFEKEIPLRQGLISAEHEDTKEVSIFTNDLLILKPLIEEELYFGINEKEPLSITIPFTGGKCEALIGRLIYE